MAELLRGQEVNEKPRVEMESTKIEVVMSAPSEQRPASPEQLVAQGAQASLLSQVHEVPEAVPVKDQLLKSVEKALADKLLVVYEKLPADRQPVFKKRGEELAAEIYGMILNKKWSPHKALTGIVSWLEMIPKVNVHYLRQEAKIKFDAVSDLYEAELNIV